MWIHEHESAKKAPDEPKEANLGSTLVLPISDHPVGPSSLLPEALQLQHPPGAAAALKIGIGFYLITNPEAPPE